MPTSIVDPFEQASGEIVDPFETPDPITAGLKPYNQIETARGAVKAAANRLGSFTIGNAASLIDAAWFVVPQIPGLIVETGSRLRNRNEPKAIRDSAAAMEKGKFVEAFDRPIGKLMKALGFGDTYDQADVEQALKMVGQAAESGGDYISEKSGGKVSKEDFLMGIDALTAGMGVAWTKFSLGKVDKRFSPTRGIEMPEARPGMDWVNKKAPWLSDEPEVGIVRPVDALPEVLEAPVEPSIGLGVGEGVAPGKRKRKGRAPVGGAPSVMGEPLPVEVGLGTGEGLATGPMARRRVAPSGEAASVMPEEPAIGLGVGEGKPGGGRRAESPAAGLLGEEYKPPTGMGSLMGRGQGGKIDPQLLKAMAAAAAGGASAYGAYQLYDALTKPDGVKKLEEIELRNWTQGAGEGALAMLTLGMVRKLPPEVPLGSIRQKMHSAPVTLMRLPNKAIITREQIQQALARSDVTKAEKGVFESVLAGGEKTFEARELAARVMEATGDFDLRAKNVETYAAHGLENIGRLTLPDELTLDGTNLTAREGSVPPSRTTVYELPEGVSTAALEQAIRNTPPDPKTGSQPHTYFPNSMGHARSFDQDGIRHVVEVQNNQAQYAEKALRALKDLTPEARAENARLADELAKSRVKLAVLQSTRPGSFASNADRAHFNQMRALQERMAFIERELKTNLDANEARLEYARIAPMLKDWPKRIVREEIAQAKGEVVRRQESAAALERDIAEAEAKVAAGKVPQEWTKGKGVDGQVYDLAVAAMDLRQGHTTEAAVRRQMLDIEDQMPPAVKARWREHYENVADETEGFLRPGPGEELGTFGNAYAAEFPRVMARFLNQELGKGDALGWQDHLDHLKSQRGMWMGEKGKEPGNVIRFATADTVAKVEGWPTTRARFSPEGPVVDNVGFSPEHQGIYDRYSRDIESFLKKEFDAKPYTDPQGHTWLEVPLDHPNAKGPIRQFGGADPKLLAAIAGIGGGAGLTWLLSSPENKAENAAIAAAVVGLAMYSKSREPGISKWASSAGQGIENILGNISAEVRAMAPTLTRRLTLHAKEELKAVHQSMQAVAPFVKQLYKVDPKLRQELAVASLTGDLPAINKALAAIGDPALRENWLAARAEFSRVGKELDRLGITKGLVSEYWPRIVADREGLLTALGREVKESFEIALGDANHKAIRDRGYELTPFEEIMLLNRHVAAPPPTGRPGFSRARKVQLVTPELLKYYVPLEEAIPLYMNAAAKAIERAKFFGDDLAVSKRTGLMNFDASIHNVIRREIAQRKLPQEDFYRLERILRARFGPGEREGLSAVQTYRNLVYLGTLASFPSAIVQFGDTIMAGALHGVMPMIKAVSAQITKNPQRWTLADVGLVDHLADEFVSGTRNPIHVAGRRVPTTAWFLDKAMKGALFSHVDAFGKGVAMNAAFERFVKLAKSEKGQASIRRQYGDYFRGDVDQLIMDLQTRGKTALTEELVFRELSDMQPVSRIEVPLAYLENPNARAAYTLRTYMLKQMNLAREKGFREIAKGDPASVRRGTEFLLRMSAGLAISGVSATMIQNWIYGKPLEGPEWDKALVNVTKTFGWSQYAIDVARKEGGVEALIETAKPPYKMFDHIIQRDPEAIQYLPLVGRIYYMREMGGAENSMMQDKKREGQAKAADLTRERGIDREALREELKRRQRERIRAESGG